MRYLVAAAFVWAIVFIASNAPTGSPYNKRGTSPQDAAGCATIATVLYVIWLISEYAF